MGFGSPATDTSDQSTASHERETVNNGNPKFVMGRLLSTPGALEALQEASQSPASLLSRHVSGDWGDMCEEDKQANERALEDGSRIFSAYVLTTGEKLWVITEAEDDQGRRVASTILKPSEY